MYLIAARCELEYGAVGAVGYNYQSIKDSIRDYGLSAKEHRVNIAKIGKYFAMKDEDFRSIEADHMINSITADDIKKTFKKEK